MLFYLQNRRNVEGRLSNQELWDLAAREGGAAALRIKSGAVKLI